MGVYNEEGCEQGREQRGNFGIESKFSFSDVRFVVISHCAWFHRESASFPPQSQNPTWSLACPPRGRCSKLLATTLPLPHLRLIFGVSFGTAYWRVPAPCSFRNPTPPPIFVPSHSNRPCVGIAHFAPT